MFLVSALVTSFISNETQQHKVQDQGVTQHYSQNALGVTARAVVVNADLHQPSMYTAVTHGGRIPADTVVYSLGPKTRRVDGLPLTDFP